MLIFINKCIKYYNTIKYLRLIQIIGQLKRFFNVSINTQIDNSKNYQLRSASSKFLKPARRNKKMLKKGTFNFLNETKNITGINDWNNSKINKLWLYNLHYFDDLNSLDSDLRVEWHKDLVDLWIENNTPGDGNGWEPYTISLRIVNWVKWHLNGHLLKENAIHSLLIQTRFLSKNIETHLLGNHLFSNAKALIFAGLFFDHSEAESWYNQGLKLVNKELPEQILKDGGSFELSTMYHVLLLEDLLDLLNIHNTFERSPPKGIEEKIKLMYSWLIAMSHPDGEISFFNDSAFNIAPSPKEIKNYIITLNKNKLIKVDIHKIINQPIVNLNYSGYTRLQIDNLVLIVDRASIGPDYLPGHAHADTFSFELSLFNQRVIVNSGTSTYEKNIERHYQRSTAAHSTVMIDEKNSSEVWGGFRVARRARVFNLVDDVQVDKIMVSASHSGYHRLFGKPTHSRKWKLSESLLEITDSINGKGSHDIDLVFPLHPEVKILNFDKETVYIDILGNKAEINFVGTGELFVETSNYHPEFGLSLENMQLHYRISEKLPAVIITRVNW
tara:strand:- start:5896 stop:7566 length:1671 start_codon:yes stop_codon:yes gene_type:complete